jgi:hypothetical protein
MRKRGKDGSIKKILVAKRGTVVTQKFRRVGINIHKEVIYKKRVLIKDGLQALKQVTRASHGCTGWIGLYPGHPDLLTTSTEPVSPPQSLITKTPPTCPSELAAWFFGKAKPGMTKVDLLKELQLSPEVLDDDNNSSNSSSCEGLVSYGMNT